MAESPDASPLMAWYQSHDTEATQLHFCLPCRETMRREAGPEECLKLLFKASGQEMPDDLKIIDMTAPYAVDDDDFDPEDN